MAEKFPSKTVQVALTGATYVELIPAPADTETAYELTRFYGQNDNAGARTLSIAFNNGGTRTICWTSQSAAQNEQFRSLDGGDESQPIDLVVSSTGQSIDMKASGACTGTIAATYKIMETK